MEDDAWKSTPSKHNDLESALEKEKTIKDIMSVQEGLKALLSRIEDVTEENQRLTDENATLQLYVENMTRNTAMLGPKDGKR
ncbi:hypothetical protein EMMF5_004120 [Cystobasidiomycetes sp. EMM_F5]